MRLFGALLFATLTSTMAFADEAKPADPPPAPPAEAAPAPSPAPAPVVKAAKVPLRVVRILPESHQALLFDKLKNTHVLADIGKTVDGYKVEDIDDDEVTLTAENGSQVVLAAPDPAWRRHRRDDAADEARPARPARTTKAKADAATAKADAGAKPDAANAMPEDPYASSAAPQDPYDMAAAMGDAPMTKDGVVRSVESPDALNEIRSVDAPAKPIPGAGAVVTGSATAKPARTATATDSTAPAAVPTAPTANATVPTASATAPTSATTAPTSTASSSAPSATAAASAATSTDSASDSFFGSETPSAGAPAPAAPAAAAPVGSKAADGPTVISRGEVNAALGNFGALASAIHGSFTPTGAKLDSVADGSLFAKAGLHSGDTLTAVNGQPLRSIDDAANVYARASSAKLLTVQVQRAGKPMTLRVAIQ